MTAHLYIIRGVSGAGKSTLARKMVDTHMADVFFEADMWMCDAAGNYQYSHDNLKYCHDQCLINVRRHLDAGKVVAVSNTFTRIWEIQPYLHLGFPYTVIRLERAFDNVHGVPPEKVEAMRGRFETFDVSGGQQ